MLEITVSGCRIRYPCIENVLRYGGTRSGAWSQKNKDAWRKRLGDLRSRIRYSSESACLPEGRFDGRCSRRPFARRADSDGNLNVFNVEHGDDGRWLNANNGHPDNRWNPDNVWVFARRNPPYFSPYAGFGEFSFSVRLPCHPPSMRPTSFNFSDKATYF